MATTESFHEGMHLSGDSPLTPAAGMHSFLPSRLLFFIVYSVYHDTNNAFVTGEEGSPMFVLDSEDPKVLASKKRKADSMKFCDLFAPVDAEIVKPRNLGSSGEASYGCTEGADVARG